MSWRDGMFYCYLFWVEAVKMNLLPRLFVPVSISPSRDSNIGFQYAGQAYI